MISIASRRTLKSLYLKSSLVSLYCDGGNLYHVNADLSICGNAAERVCCSAESCRAQTLIDRQPDLRRRRTVTWLTRGREKARRHCPGLSRPHSAIPAYIT